MTAPLEPCPACGRTGREYLRATDLNQGLSGAVFRYYRCSSCALVFLAPVPDDLGSYYVDSYVPYQAPSRAELPSRAAPEQFKLELVQRFARSGRLLEVGPGFGAFAYLAKEAGFEVDALERASGSIEYLREVVGVNVVTTDRVSSAAGRLSSFDVITLWQSLEHLPDAWEALATLAACLRPGGHLVVSTPNPDSIQFRTFGKYWFHLDAPRHVQLIPSAALKARAETLGLSLVALTTNDAGSTAVYGFDRWFLSLVNLVKAQFGPPPQLPVEERRKSWLDWRYFLRRDQLIQAAARSPLKTLRLVSSLGVRCALSPFLKRFERREGLGAGYVAVFKRQVAVA